MGDCVRLAGRKRDGSVRLKMSDFILQNVPSGGAVPTPIAGMGFWGGYPIGSLPPTALAANGVVAAVGDVLATAFYIAQQITITHVTIEVTTAQGSTAIIDTGLYNSAGSLVINTAGFNGNSATVQTLVVSQGGGSVVLPAGWYWYAWTASVTNVTMRAANFNINTAVFGRDIVNKRAATFLSGKALTAASANLLPSVLPALTTANDVNLLAAWFS